MSATTAEVQKSAWLSDCGRYRYLLWHTWDTDAPPLAFVMLNPSTADAEVDDPTIRRCMGFARRDGHGGIVVVNLYAYRATKPADLWRAADPIGPENDQHLRWLFGQARGFGFPVVAAWGANAKPSRVAWVRSMRHADVLHHLGLTAAGTPRHPLYLHRDAPLTRWSAPSEQPAQGDGGEGA